MEDVLERFVDTLYRHVLLAQLAGRAGRDNARALAEARTRLAECLGRPEAGRKTDDVRYAMAVLADAVFGRLFRSKAAAGWDRPLEAEFFGTHNGATFKERAQRAVSPANTETTRVYAAVCAIGGRCLDGILPERDALLKDLRAAAGAGAIEEPERLCPQAYRGAKPPGTASERHGMPRAAICAAGSIAVALLAGGLAWRHAPAPAVLIGAVFLTIALLASACSVLAWHDQRRRSATLAALCGAAGPGKTPPAEVLSIAESSALTSAYGVEYCRRAPLLVFAAREGVQTGETEDADDAQALVRMSEVHFPEGAAFFRVGERPGWDVAFSSQALFAKVEAGDTPLAPDRGWPQMLGALTRLRRPHPIDGVVVVLPAPALYPTRGEDPEACAARVAEGFGRTLDMIARRIGGGCPAWCIVTRVDELLGFSEFDAKLPRGFGAQLFGWANPFGAGERLDRLVLDDGLHCLYRRLAEWRLEYLAPDPDWEKACALYLFPSELKRLTSVLSPALWSLFGGDTPSRGLFLAGLFITSGGIVTTRSPYECCGFVPEAADVAPDLLTTGAAEEYSFVLPRLSFDPSRAFIHDLFHRVLLKEGYFRPAAG